MKNKKMTTMGFWAVLGFGGMVSAATWIGTTDDNWSTSGNWAGGTPPGGTDLTALIGADAGGIIQLDVEPDVSFLNFGSGVVTNFAVNGSNTLLLKQDDTSITALNNASDYRQSLNADVSIQGASTYRVSDGGIAGLEYNGDFSTDSLLELRGVNIVNKRLLTTSGATVRIASSSDVTFNNMLDNDIDSLVISANGAKLTVNTADGVNFYSGTVIQVNQNSQLTFNGANVIGDTTRLVVGSATTDVDVEFNADETLGYISIVGSGLTLNLGEDVSTLIFGDSSSQTWNNGLVITNFRGGVIGFGTDGLTGDQLDSISVFDSLGTDVSDLLEMDSSGFLVIPEPATVGLFVLAAGVIGLYRRQNCRD
jgi:hypothetical protein